MRNLTGCSLNLNNNVKPNPAATLSQHYILASVTLFALHGGYMVVTYYCLGISFTYTERGICLKIMSS